MNKKELIFEEGVYEDGPRYGLSVKETDGRGMLTIDTVWKGRSSGYDIDENKARAIVMFFAEYYCGLEDMTEEDVIEWARS